MGCDLTNLASDFASRTFLCGDGNVVGTTSSTRFRLTERTDDVAVVGTFRLAARAMDRAGDGRGCVILRAMECAERVLVRAAAANVCVGGGGEDRGVVTASVPGEMEVRNDDGVSDKDDK